MNDIQTIEDITYVKKYQNYILDGRIMNAKKYYRYLNNLSKMSGTLVQAKDINSLTDTIIKIERDVLNKTGDWVTYQEMDQSALIGDIAFV